MTQKKTTKKVPAKKTTTKKAIKTNKNSNVKKIEEIDDEYNIEMYECKGDFDIDTRECWNCPVINNCTIVSPFYKIAKERKIDVNPYKSTKEIIIEVSQSVCKEIDTNFKVAKKLTSEDITTILAKEVLKNKSSWGWAARTALDKRYKTEIEKTINDKVPIIVETIKEELINSINEIKFASLSNKKGN